MDGIALATAALEGDRRSIARLISAIENEEAGWLDAVSTLYPRSGRARVIGITGPPGAGKSTLLDALITHIRSKKLTVGALLVDPSSPFSGGAMLGDRIRMITHTSDPGVFVRSLATRNLLGGLSVATARSVVILDALGMDVVLVETVGVGQSEIDVMNFVETTVVLVSPGWGDDVQASKAGILEIGDIFVVNKADREGAKEAVRYLRQMLGLQPRDGWKPPVLATVATSGKGVEALWDACIRHSHANGGSMRGVDRARLERELRSAVVTAVAKAAQSATADLDLDPYLDGIAERRLDPWSAADVIANHFLSGSVKQR